MQPGHPSDPIGQPGLGQPASRLVLDLDVVMVLRPVVSDEQQSVLPSLHTDCVRVSSLRENYQRPNEQVLTPLSRRARHPISGRSSRPPAGARSHIRTSSTSSAFECSPASGYQLESLNTEPEPSLGRWVSSCNTPAVWVDEEGVGHTVAL